MGKNLGETRIRAVRGDITEMDCDAVVNAANNHLWMGAGVAGAIKRKGGVEIEKEAVAKGPIAIGEAVATGAGALKARFVIHAAAMGQDLETDEEKIRSATRNSLKRAEELGLRSIAFPALGTGVGGFPAAEAARVMVGAVVDEVPNLRTLRDVAFCLFDEATLRAFEKEITQPG